MKSFKTLSSLLFITLIISGCMKEHKKVSNNKTMSSDNIEAIIPGKDYHSFANTDEAVITHITLGLDVNFDDNTIHGNNWVFFHRLKPNSQQIILDTKELSIIDVNTKFGKNITPLKWKMGQKDKNLGQALIIDLPDDEKQPIIIEYKTSPDASGLQWLTPEQTTGKNHPFLYSQSQAIHARSWIPLQDSPQVRQTYSATVNVNRKLRAVMSANNNPKANTKLSSFRFNMPQPIPSYLIALGVGDLTYKKISHRSGVWAEPAIVTRATYEFEDTEKMIQEGEKLYGRYAWDQYDLLILPSSFPFGGMENPRLSFITPTVVAGDKSLVALIAHELAHSWSGNLVTNASWRDLWLNEGFTTYFESRITEATSGIEIRDMNAVLEYNELIEELKELPENDQKLALDVRGRDPDDAFSGVPYTKGKMFLEWLEQAFGRMKFDRFVKKYFDDFAFQSINTEIFLEYLDKNLIQKHPNKVTQNQINQWVYQAGLPDTAIVPTTNVFDLIDTQSNQWIKNTIKLSQIPTKSWNTQQWLYFLNNLPKKFKADQMQNLDKAFDLTNASNSEIAHIWFLLSIKYDYQYAFDNLEKYLIEVGRRKLIVPLYKQLAQTKNGQIWGKNVYKKARPGYHSLARNTIDKIFAQ